MKTYKINGEEIEELEVERKIPLEKHEFSTRDPGLRQKFNQLLEALDEKKEEWKPCTCPKGSTDCEKCDGVQYLKEEPKSTLSEKITEIVHKGEYNTDKQFADKIISLFKDTLLKEIANLEAPMEDEDGREITSDLAGELETYHEGYFRTINDVTNLIKNL